MTNLKYYALGGLMAAFFVLVFVSAGLHFGWFGAPELWAAIKEAVTWYDAR